MMKRLLALGLLAALVTSGLAYLMPLAAAADNFSGVSATVEPSQNILGSSTTFSPGDDIRVDLVGTGSADGAQDIFDVGLFRGGGRTQSDLMILADNVALDANGKAVAVLPGSLTRLLDDGAYQIDVCYQDYSLTYNCAGGNDKLPGFLSVSIQLFTVSVTTDRDAYIPGETVTAYWKNLYIKNGTPAGGFNGNLYFYEGSSSRQYASPLATAVGNLSFVIPTGANTATNHSVTVTWDGTSNGGRRSGVVTRNTVVGNMLLDVWVSSGSVPAGSPFTVYLASYVSYFGSTYPLPGAQVNVSIFLDNPAPIADIYYSNLRWSVTTDSAGRAAIALMATDPFAAVNTYGVVANGTKILKLASDQTFFTVVRPTYPITVTLTLDGSRYLAGALATATASAVESPGRGAPTSYVFTETVRDTSGLTIARREDVLTTGSIAYRLPLDFDGTIQVDVAVYNAAGDRGFASVTATVVSTEVLVNADPQIYQAGQTIRVTLASGLSSPNYLYAVTSGSYTLLQGNTTASSFSFDIPANPHASYSIVVQATSGGRSAAGSTVITLRSGFAVHFAFDRANYIPGEVATVTYRIEAFGNARLPDAFRVSICFNPCSSAFTRSYTTTKAEDAFPYPIDASLDPGNIEATVVVYSISGSFLGSASEIVAVNPSGNPLWYSRLADIPLMEWILLALVVFLLVLVIRGGLFPGIGAGRGPRAPAAPKPPRAPQERAPPPGAGVATCSHCGNPIDVTTSKRPVEVLCPHCGETTVVDRETPTTWEPPPRAGRNPP